MGRTLFALQIKQTLRRPSFWVLLLLMPFSLLLLRATDKAGPEEEPPLAGYYLPQNSGQDQRLEQQLLSFDGYFSFQRADSPEELQNKVASGQYECGYLLPDDWQERAQNGKWRKLITCFTAPSSVLDPIINETMTAAFMETCWPDIAASALQKQGIPANADELLQRLPAEPHRMQVETQYEGDRADFSSESATSTALPRGMIAIGGLLLALMALISVQQDRVQQFFGRLRPITRPLGLVVPCFAAWIVPCFAACALSVSLARRIFPGFGSLGAELISLLAYWVYLSGMCVLFATLLHHRPFPIVLIPFLLVACLVLCPILFDAGRFAPLLGKVSVILPPTLYLRGAEGNALYTRNMFLLGGLFFVVSVPLLVREAHR